MTNQEIFNTVLHTIRARDYVAATCSPDAGRCVYKSEDGMKCAVGLFISDKNYTPVIEGVTMYHLNAFALGTASEEYLSVEAKILLDILRSEGIRDDQLTLLRDLQAAHDNFLPKRLTYIWEDKMCQIAINNGVSYS